MYTHRHANVRRYMWTLWVKPDLALVCANLGVATASQVELFS